MALPFRETLKASLKDSSLHSGWRAFILCLSFANLCFLNTWAELQDHRGDFFKVSTATTTHLAAVTLDILILAAILWIPVVLAVRSGKPIFVRVLKWCILAGMLVPINVLRKEPVVIRSGRILLGGNGRIIIGIAGIALGIFLFLRWQKLSPRVASAILTILLPTLPITCVITAWRIYVGPSGVLPRRPLWPALPQNAGAPHVVWIIFDEWDQTLTFNARAADLKLPELDRFRRQALYASRAYPPGRQTDISVPSLLSGKTFTKSTRQGISDILETYSSGLPPEPLSAQETIFEEAHAGGFNVGAAGWWLPYSRLFKLTARSEPGADDTSNRSLLGLMLDLALEQYRALPLATRLGIAQHAPSVDHLAVYHRLHKDAIRLVRDTRLNVVFLHFNVPHWPFIYNADGASYSTSDRSTYLDNLVLVDRTLGDIRQTLEQEGRWDSTTILLTSDHPLRVNLWRTDYKVNLPVRVQQSNLVPFLLKMAGERQGVEYPHAMQTVVT